MQSDDTKKNSTGFSHVDAYEWAEFDYPGYDKLLAEAAIQATPPDIHPDVVEIGPGPGALTKRIAFARTNSVRAVELDPECAAHLQRKIDNGELPLSELVKDDFIKWAENPEQTNTADIAVSSFVRHHIHPAQADSFAKANDNLLRKEGVAIVADAFLPAHDETDPAARIQAHLDLHIAPIMQRFKEGKLQFPILELESLASGIATTHEFLKITAKGYAPESKPDNAPHPANRQAISYLKMILDDAKNCAANWGDAHTDDQNPKTSASEKRTEFTDKLEGMINGLETSPIPGIDPAYFKDHPDICSIGACDYKITMKQFADQSQNQGFAVQAKHITDDNRARPSQKIDGSEAVEGGLWVARLERSGQHEQSAIKR